MATRTARLEMRLKPEDKLLLERAAVLSGQPLTSFALASLLDRARALVAESATISLSPRDLKRFFEILEADEEPAPALKAAVRRYRRGRG
ncbi:MAG TPA: DUF1778 domain-containing protein [Planctomycetota bacterium]